MLIRASGCEGTRSAFHESASSKSSQAQRFLTQCREIIGDTTIDAHHPTMNAKTRIRSSGDVLRSDDCIDEVLTRSEVRLQVIMWQRKHGGYRYE